VGGASSVGVLPAGRVRGGRVSVRWLFLGLAYLVSDGQQIMIPGSLKTFATSRVGGIATSFWIALGVVLVLLVMIRLTTFGRRFVATGSEA
jgi:ribose transport system permease protein